MKKVSLLIFLIVICYLGYGQTYPVQQNLGAATTLVKTPNYGGLQSGLIPYTFSDTSAANTALTYLKNYNGALIYTTGDSSLWYRSSNASRWTPVLQSGGTSGIRAWLDGGNQNVLADGATNATFGTLGLNGISFKTNATSRFILGNSGIRPDTGTTSPIGVGADGYLHYTSGGGGAGWLLAGNAGTNPATDFIGTTDDVDVVFKRQGNEVGRLNNDNISMGYIALTSITTGIGNTAYGSISLLNTTEGDLNIALGKNAGRNHVDGDNRLYINSIQRSNLGNDTTQSIIYGAQDATASNQRLYLNSQVYAPYITSQYNSADSMVVVLPGTGKFGYRVIPSGGSSGITVGTTTITSGTSGKVLQDSSGFVGEVDIINTDTAGAKLGDAAYFVKSTNTVQFMPFDSTLYLNFTVGETYAPGIGDSILIHSDFSSKRITAYRQGAYQHASSDSGITVSGDTVFFHPPFAYTDKVSLELRDSTHTRTLALEYNEVPVFVVFNLSDGGVSESPTHQYNCPVNSRVSNSTTSLTGDGYVDFKYSGNGLVIGLDATSALEDYYTSTTINYNYLIYTFSGTIYGNVLGALQASPIVIGAVGSVTNYRLSRTGGTVKLLTSTDGVSYSDTYTFVPTTGVTLYVKGQSAVGTAAVIDTKSFGFF